MSNEIPSMKKEVAGLVQAFGYSPIESKNPYMISFYNSDSKKRINYYFTTNTLTVQSLDGGCATYRGIRLARLEDILCQR